MKIREKKSHQKMALPADLRRLIWQHLPFMTTEKFPAAALRLWLATVAPSTPVATAWQSVENDMLTAQEVQLKIASWSGLVGYANQLFLPYGLPLLQAALACNLPVFIDAFLRGQRHNRAAIAVLRQVRQQPAVAETMLSYLLAPGSGLEINVNELIDEMLLGRIVLTPSICLLLHRDLASRNIRTLTDKRIGDFIAGVTAAFAQSRVAPVEQYSHQDFLSGYALAGGRDFTRFTPAFDPSIIDSVYALLNLPEAPLPATNLTSAFATIAYHIIEKLPKSGTELFPGIHFSFVDYSYELYAERARYMLPLLAEVYAPSTELDKYRDYLRLLITPNLRASELSQIPDDQEFLSLLGRFDLFDAIPDFEQLLRLQRIYRPEALIDLTTQLPTNGKISDLIRMALGQAALQGRLVTVATYYFTQLSPYFRRDYIVADQKSPLLEIFREVYYLVAAKYSYPHNWTNSFMLQWVASAFTEYTLSEGPKALPSIIILEFVCNGKKVSEIANAYDYATWRTVLPQLPALALPNPLLERVRWLRNS